MGDKPKMKLNAYRKVAKSGKVYYRAYRYGVGVSIFEPNEDGAMGMIIEFDDLNDLPNHLLQTGTGPAAGPSGFDGMFGSDESKEVAGETPADDDIPF